MNLLKYKSELALMRAHNVDITKFESELEIFKTAFARNYVLSAGHFQKAIAEIDKSIDHLQKTKDALLGTDRNLRLAYDKAQDVTIKKLALTAGFGIERSEWSKSIEAIVKAARDNRLSAAQLRPMGARNADLMLANWPAPLVSADPTAELSQALTTAVNSVVQFMQVSKAAGSEPTKVLRDGVSELQRFS